MLRSECNVAYGVRCSFFLACSASQFRVVRGCASHRPFVRSLPYTNMYPFTQQHPLTVSKSLSFFDTGQCLTARDVVDAVDAVVEVDGGQHDSIWRHVINTGQKHYYEMSHRQSLVAFMRITGAFG
jgi:hypothetical protein